MQSERKHPVFCRVFSFVRMNLTRSSFYVIIKRVCSKNLLLNLKGELPVSIYESRVRQLYKGQVINLPECDGTQVIVNAPEVFRHIGRNFGEWKVNDPGSATPRCAVEVYELMKNSSFWEMFRGFAESFDDLCFTDSQIIAFCRLHRNKLHDEGSTHFLRKSRSELYVVRVYMDSRRLEAYVGSFFAGHPQAGKKGYRLVIPQI